MFCENYAQFVSELKNRNYTVHSAKNAAEAKDIALSLIGSATVGCGGSITVQSLGLPDALRAQGCEVYFHWEHTAAELPSVFHKAASSEWYICSTNAITRAGKLVNIDGNANRVASMIYGPKKILLIIGKNKFTETVDKALDRIKTVVCPKNAQRLKRTIPCAKTGKCVNCYSPQRMCNVTTIIEAKPGLISEMHLLLVDEELGY